MIDRMDWPHLLFDQVSKYTLGLGGLLVRWPRENFELGVSKLIQY